MACPSVVRGRIIIIIILGLLTLVMSVTAVTSWKIDLLATTNMGANTLVGLVLPSALAAVSTG
jgi:hypothetical protein